MAQLVDRRPAAHRTPNFLFNFVKKFLKKAPQKKTAAVKQKNNVDMETRALFVVFSLVCVDSFVADSFLFFFFFFFFFFLLFLSLFFSLFVAGSERATWILSARRPFYFQNGVCSGSLSIMVPKYRKNDENRSRFRSMLIESSSPTRFFSRISGLAFAEKKFEENRLFFIEKRCNVAKFDFFFL